MQAKERHAVCVLNGILRGHQDKEEDDDKAFLLYLVHFGGTWLKSFELLTGVNAVLLLLCFSTFLSRSLSRFRRGQYRVHTLTLTTETCGKWRNFNVRCKFECRMHKTWRNVWLKNVNKWWRHCYREGESGGQHEKVRSHANPLENRHQVDS